MTAVCSSLRSDIENRIEADHPVVSVVLHVTSFMKDFWHRVKLYKHKICKKSERRCAILFQCTVYQSLLECDLLEQVICFIYIISIC